MRFRLVPQSTTLYDLEGPLRTVSKYMLFFGAHHENLNEDRHISDEDVAQCPMTLDSGNIRFMRIFAYRDMKILQI